MHRQKEQYNKLSHRLNEYETWCEPDVNKKHLLNPDTIINVQP